jgi:putative selenate reductase FAD-binding subunit
MVMEVLRPSRVEEAVLLGSQEGAAFLGGGTWLNSGRAGPVRTLVSLERLGLGAVTRSGASVSIGAAASFQSVRESAAAPAALRDAVGFTASRTLRNMVTVGGELGLLPQDSVLVPVLLALDAEVRMAGAAASVPMSEYCRRRPPGLILGVTIPDADRPCAVGRVARTSRSPRSLVVAASAPRRGAARIVLSDCRGSLQAVADVEEIASRFSPAADVHASAAYKSYMARVMAEDLLAALAEAPR